jgi:arsenate reductase-like glutaredoxin family protein
MDETILFWKSTCSTCRRVRGLVREIGSDVRERNYAKEPLSRKEIKSIVNTSGSVADLVNTRHAIAKQHGWKAKPPSKTALIRAAVEDVNVLRRPILVRGKRRVVGRDADAVRAFLA